MSAKSPHQPAPKAWETTTEKVRSLCQRAGFDLVQPLQVSWYNREVDQEYRLPNYDRGNCLAILVGNTKALWLQFLEALRTSPSLQRHPHPIDTYTRQSVERALAPIPYRWLTRYAHNHRVAMQRMAHVAGLAYLSPSHLSIHPEYGPWIALRAVAVIDINGPDNAPQPLQPPCICESNCTPAFRAAIAQADRARPTQESIATHWRQWLAVRDACPIGRIHRYTDAQIRYHYRKDRRQLQGVGTV